MATVRVTLIYDVTVGDPDAEVLVWQDAKFSVQGQTGDPDSYLKDVFFEDLPEVDETGRGWKPPA